MRAHASLLMISVILGATLIALPEGGGREGDVGIPTTRPYAPYGMVLLPVGLILGALVVVLPSSSASMVRE